MMTENNNPVVMTWFQQQQTPAGWFDLLVIMVEGMLNNAGELESQPFLRQMGASLAETHPLPASEPVPAGNHLHGKNFPRWHHL